MKCGFEDETCASTFVRLARESSGEVPLGSLRELRTRLVEASSVPRRSLSDRHLLAGLQIVSRLTTHGMILSQEGSHDVYFGHIEARVVVPLFVGHGLIKADRAYDTSGSKGKVYTCLSLV